MGKMNDWLLKHIDEYTDEELEEMGYTEEDIKILRGA